MRMRRLVKCGFGGNEMLRYLSLVLWITGTLGFSVAHASDEVEPIDEVFEPARPKNINNYGKVAVIQWAPSGTAPLGVKQSVVDAYKKRTREALAKEIRAAARAGAELVITPEFALVGYPDIPELPSEDDNFRNRADVAPYVEPVPGTSTRYFGELARELGIYLHIGFVEVDRKTDAYYNTVVALDPRGEIVARYRKMSLFRLEEEFLSSGREGVYYDSPFGRIGIIICADVYAQQPIQTYRRNKVDVLALSTSWAQMNTGWSYFTRAARQANMYLLAANMPYFPDSGVINPDGSSQSHIRQSDGMAFGYLPRK
jgi:predicted amidohydrolase